MAMSFTFLSEVPAPLTGDRCLGWCRDPLLARSCNIWLVIRAGNGGSRSFHNHNQGLPLVERAYYRFHNYDTMLNAEWTLTQILKLQTSRRFVSSSTGYNIGSGGQSSLTTLMSNFCGAQPLA